MTGNWNKQLIFGLLAWGLFVFSTPSANAQLSPFGASGNAARAIGAQIIRSGGQEAVDKLAEKAGYQSDNIKAVSNDDAKQLLREGYESQNRTGALNAAKARMSGSDNALKGAWNAISGAAKDLFRSSDEIAADLETYRNEENSQYIDNAIAAAKDVQGEGSNILSGNMKSIPDRLDKINAAANAVAVYETADGQKIYLDMNMESLNGMMKGCVPLPLKLEQSRKCILCPLFVILFNTAQAMSSASYNTLAAGFSNLLLIGFALYVAYVTLKQVSSFTKQDGPKYVSDLLTMSFKVLLAYLILQHVDQLYNLVLEPLLSAAMDFGGAFLFRSADSNADNSFMACAAASQLPDGVSIYSGYYSPALFAKIDCFVRSIQQELAVATSIGSSLMCVAQEEASHLHLLPDFSMLFAGLIIWVFSWLVCLAFGFYLIDSVVRLGVIGGLMPFLIAAWPFKLTSGYTKKGWDMFMNAFFTFVFLGLVVSVNIELGLQAVTGGEGGYDKIMELINANEVKPLVEIMSIGLTGLLFLILCCIFGFKLCAEAVSLAAQMSGGQSGNIGSNIASIGAGVAKWGTTKSLKAGGKVAQRIGTKVGEATGLTDAVHSVEENISKKINNVGAKFGQAAGLKGFGAGGAGAKNNAAAANAQGSAANAAKPNAAAGKDQAGENNTDSDATANKKQTGQAAPAGNARRNAQDGASSGNNDANNSAAQVMNTNTAQGADTNAAVPATDGGAANAEPRGNNDNNNASTTNVNQTVVNAKQQIADAAQNAAANKGNASHADSKNAVRQQGNNGAKKDKNQNNEELKRAKSLIEDLKKQISALEIEKDKLEKKINSQNNSQGSGTSNSDAEQLKKVTEAKEKAEAQLNSLLDSMKEQK